MVQKIDLTNKKTQGSLAVGIILLIAIIFVIAIIGYIVSRPKALVIQGEVEANEYRVSGKVPGRIEELYVREGQAVHKGDTVVNIDSPEVRAKLAQARGAVAAARAQSAKAQHGARQEQITGAYELWQQALVQEDVMHKSFERVQRLYDQKVISAQKYDETKARYDAAVAQTKAAKSQYDMAVNGARYEDRAAAQALVAQANGAVQEVQSYLGELYLTSPADGIISATYPKVGELVGTGTPIMSIAVMNDQWATFNIREDQLKDIKVGSELTVRIPAIDKETKMKVTSMKDKGSFAVWKATKATGQYDLKTFEVKARPVEKVESLRPGMSLILKGK